MSYIILDINLFSVKTYVVTSSYDPYTKTYLTRDATAPLDTIRNRVLFYKSCQVQQVFEETEL